jgi:hypothetical protein
MTSVTMMNWKNCASRRCEQNASSYIETVRSMQTKTTILTSRKKVKSFQMTSLFFVPIVSYQNYFQDYLPGRFRYDRNETSEEDEEEEEDDYDVDPNVTKDLDGKHDSDDDDEDRENQFVYANDNTTDLIKTDNNEADNITYKKEIDTNLVISVKFNPKSSRTKTYAKSRLSTSMNSSGLKNNDSNEDEENEVDTLNNQQPKRLQSVITRPVVNPNSRYLLSTCLKRKILNTFFSTCLRKSKSTVKPTRQRCRQST